MQSMTLRAHTREFIEAPSPVLEVLNGLRTRAIEAGVPSGLANRAAVKLSNPEAPNSETVTITPGEGEMTYVEFSLPQTQEIGDKACYPTKFTVWPQGHGSGVWFTKPPQVEDNDLRHPYQHSMSQQEIESFAVDLATMAERLPQISIEFVI